jgi:hypothetical protein
LSRAFIKKTSVVKVMDCRVEPGNDVGESMLMTAGMIASPRLVARA